jgi:hypothetical protein
MSPAALLRVPLALARRASVAIRRALAGPLSILVYVLAMPWLWVLFRLRRPRPAGWIARADRDVGTLHRLRRPF